MLLLFTVALYILMCAARLAVQMLFPLRAEAPAGTPAEHMVRGVAYLKEAEENVRRGALYRFFVFVPFSSKYQAAAGLFEKAAIAFILAKSWDKAGSAYIKVANCYQNMFTKDEVDPFARAYVSAANCYKKTNFEESISCLKQAANLFLGVGRLDESTTYYMQIAKLHEAEQNFDQAVLYYETAADLFYIKQATISLIVRRRKVAPLAAQLENYEKSIEIYEDLARQSLRNNENSEATKLLLCAGVCKLCKGEGDVVAINNALERYKDLDPTFSDTREYCLLVNLADAVDQVDVAKFSEAVKGYGFRGTQQDAWTLTLLSRLKEVLKF